MKVIENILDAIVKSSEKVFNTRTLAVLILMKVLGGGWPLVVVLITTMLQFITYTVVFAHDSMIEPKIESEPEPDYPGKYTRV